MSRGEVCLYTIILLIHWCVSGWVFMPERFRKAVTTGVPNDVRAIRWALQDAGEASWDALLAIASVAFGLVLAVLALVLWPLELWIHHRREVSHD